MKNVGKPCDREGHARIDGGRLETGHLTTDPEKNGLVGNHRTINGSETYRRTTLPRQSPTLLRYGHSSDRFDTISAYAIERLALFIGKRHQRGRRCGLSVLAYQSPDRCGLVRLSGIVVAPRANKPWREKPNAGGERRR